jgi:hypothetical protein
MSNTYNYQDAPRGFCGSRDEVAQPIQNTPFIIDELSKLEQLLALLSERISVLDSKTMVVRYAPPVTADEHKSIPVHHSELMEDLHKKCEDVDQLIQVVDHIIETLEV